MPAPSVATPVAPLTLVARLDRQSRWLAPFARDAGRWRVLGKIGSIAIAALLGTTLLVRHAAALMQGLVAQATPVAAILAVLCFGLAARRRRRLSAEYASSWLAALPIPARARDRWLARRAFVPLVLALIVAPVALAYGARASAAELRLLAVLSSVGLITAALGWSRGAHPAATRVHVMRLPRGRRSRSSARRVLASLPFAQALAAANPTVHARLIGALVLTIPIGVPAHVCLLIMLVGATAVAAFELARGLAACIPVAASWLRSTPVTFAEFFRRLCVPALCVQGLLASALLVGSHALGASSASSTLLAAAWLGGVVTLTGAAIACRHAPDRLHGELAATGAIAIALWMIAPAVLAIALPALWTRQWQRARSA